VSQIQKENPDLAITGSAGSGSSRPIFLLAHQQAERLRDQTGTLRLKLNGNLIRLNKEAEIPLTKTGMARIPNALVRLTGINWAQYGNILMVREVGYMDAQAWSSLPTVYLLVDRKKRTGTILTKQYQSQSAFGSNPMERFTARLNLQSSPNSSTSDLVLYVYEETIGPAFDSDIVVPDYTMHPGDNSFGGDYVDVSIARIATSPQGVVNTNLLITSFTKKPIKVATDAGGMPGGGYIGGREGDTFNYATGFYLNPERTPAPATGTEAPWQKRLLIHEGDKRRLKPGDRWYFDDFLTPDGVRHDGYIEVQN